MTSVTRPSDPARRSILIACAHPDICFAFTYFLTAKGYDVECVSDGKVCLERIQHRAFSAVILNHWLPILDCPILITQLRAIEPTLPIIFSTVVGASPIGNHQENVAVLQLPFHQDELYESLQLATFLVTSFGSNGTAPRPKT